MKKILALVLILIALIPTAVAEENYIEEIFSYAFRDWEDLTYVYRKVSWLDDGYTAESLTVYAEDDTIIAIFERVWGDEWYEVCSFGHEEHVRQWLNVWIENMETNLIMEEKVRI